MNKELDALEKIKQAHYFVDFELDAKVGEDYKNELDIIEKSLKALEIIKKYIKLENYEDDYAELIPYFFKDTQYVSLRSSKCMSREEYDLLKEVFHDE